MIYPSTRGVIIEGICSETPLGVVIDLKLKLLKIIAMLVCNELTSYNLSKTQ